MEIISIEYNRNIS